MSYDVSIFSEMISLNDITKMVDGLASFYQSFHVFFLQ